MQTVEQYLSNKFGQPVWVERDPRNNLLHVHVSELSNSQKSLSKTGPKTKKTARSGKQPPRPMNCFILYRNSMHKAVKEHNPDATVQEISKMLSETWAGMSDDEKNIWRREAEEVKDKHLRVFPGYKYNPRKPGEKQKRQPRKSRPATTTTSVATASPSSTAEMFDFSAFPDNTLLTYDATSAPPHTLTVFAAGTNNVPANNIAINSMAGSNGQVLIQSESSSSTINTPAFDSHYLYFSEALRQARLETEFKTGSPELNHNDQVAFRIGADGNATLPSVYQERF
ncbi:hypothetical protein K504DRAFT_379456 [Pleomassaria siparia CBS 279.74]|uniref:HMG box domain-containing protein n=1 Tax=Pleomassaria siparia CBS 279.74 TaxID=1314801 RepID=A0A6G1KBJ7_9PLEO|nr:hypothetical protein K504DRAFT_379456 [Pleomassaria siparia CBS 279.74]